MIKKPRHFNFNLLIAFILPVAIMGCYFAVRQMAPFGQNSILTVDLGQQYVDFFAYFRNMILHHPSSLFYSFSKGLGGEMFGTNAYYLFSPLNLVLLFFPGQLLSSGILLLVLLKDGLAGLSFAWFLQRQKLQTPPRSWAFSTAYALMGWMIANQLNILWLDVLFILPPVIDGLIQLAHGGSPWRYIAWLTVAIIDNYYMAWMLALFTFLFMIWLTVGMTSTWRGKAKFVGRFFGSSIASGLLSAVVLLPTIYALTQSKGTYTEQTIKWATEYNPLKILAKLVPGSFNFGQMPSGQPNIYVGMLLTIGFVLYFIYSQDRLAVRFTALAISAFIIASFCLQPFDLLWHLGQFPVWYPSRFSFVFSFWMIYLAARTLKPNFTIKWPTALFLAVAVFAVTAYLWANQRHISYISTSQLSIGCGLAIISIVMLMLRRDPSPRMADFLFVLLVVLDVSTSAFVALNHISYVSQGEFGNYTTAMNQAIKKAKSGDSGFYRIAKNFMRTKDDPFQSDYYGGEHFSSTMEPTVSSFMSSIGQPAGDGFVAYSNGTQVTDSLFGFKYFLQAKNHGMSNDTQMLPITSTRADWYHLANVSSTNMVNIKKNANALPIAFGASTKILDFKSVTLDPLNYQSQLFQLLAGNNTAQQLFKVQNFDYVTFKNVQNAKQITGTTFTRSNPLKNASVTLHFTPKTNGSYYLTLGASVKNVASIKINGRTLDQYPTYHNTIVINVASHQKGKPVNIEFKLKKQAMWMQNVSLYQLDQKQFKQDVKTLQSSGLKVTSQRANQIKGTVTIKNSRQFLMTTIPYTQGWHVKVDGKSVTPFKVAGTFMGIPITKGTHKITMTYIPPYLITGLIISLMTFGGCVAWYEYRKRK
ncbi:YfhO family protein [Limosilactobacillus caecicola]|uniref:YfhO family protein n=1 Tax=Limosilactobacillus caecicola TaxID=2941332 RepID=UPI0020402E21|nr:YfhO family protein [Limosilactobacillus caecicola]